MDPEFSTFTYGDPTRPKASLSSLEKGDILAFYSGLQGWDFQAKPALYLIGYFEIMVAGKAGDFTERETRDLFPANFHVRHQDERATLILVKGSDKSRLLQTAHKISAIGSDRAGKALKVLSPEMKEIFGTFGGENSIPTQPATLGGRRSCPNRSGVHQISAVILDGGFRIPGSIRKSH